MDVFSIVPLLPIYVILLNIESCEASVGTPEICQMAAWSLLNYQMDRDLSCLSKYLSCAWPLKTAGSGDIASCMNFVQMLCICRTLGNLIEGQNLKQNMEYRTIVWC